MQRLDILFDDHEMREPSSALRRNLTAFIIDVGP
jgi:hypothetical protein